MVVRPEGMPPWWNYNIHCPHCQVFIIAFIPKHPERWQEEFQALCQRAGERCFCRKALSELLKMKAEPKTTREHTMHRVWISHAISYRVRVHKERKRRRSTWDDE